MRADLASQLNATSVGQHGGSTSEPRIVPFAARLAYQCESLIAALPDWFGLGPVFVGALYAALVPSLVLTIRSGRMEPPLFNEMLRFGHWLAVAVFGAV